MKGQAMMVDLVGGIVLFLLLITTVSIVWGTQFTTAQQQLFLKALQDEAEEAADNLVRGPGLKINGDSEWQKYWKENSKLDEVAFIGLAKMDRVIDEDKLKAFVEASAASVADYAGVKKRLNIGNDFMFRLLEKNQITKEYSTVVSYDGFTAKICPPNGTCPGIIPSEAYVAKVQRVVIFKKAGEGFAVAELTLYLER